MHKQDTYYYHYLNSKPPMARTVTDIFFFIVTLNSLESLENYIHNSRYPFIFMMIHGTQQGSRYTSKICFLPPFIRSENPTLKCPFLSGPRIRR